jgi:hypothetical protein
VTTLLREDARCSRCAFTAHSLRAHTQLREINRHLSKYEEVMGSGSVSGAKVDLAEYCLQSVLSVVQAVHASKPPPPSQQ